MCDNVLSRKEEEMEQIRRRFVRAQDDVYEVTVSIPEKEMVAIVATAVAESRQKRSGNR